MAYDNELRGVLFKHDKEGNEKRPDYKGNAQVEGVEYDLSCWIETAQKSGQKYMSIKFEPKGARPAAQDVPIDQSDFAATTTPAADDDIPF
jgi:hypothetical protein